MKLFGQSQQIPPTPPPTNTLITNLTTIPTATKLTTIQPHRRRNKRLQRLPTIATATKLTTIQPHRRRDKRLQRLPTIATATKLMTIQPHRRRNKRLRQHLIGKTRCPSHAPLPNSPRLALTWNWYTIKTLYGHGSPTHPRTSVLTQCMMKRSSTVST